MSRESASTATEAPKRLLTPRREMFTLLGEFLQPLLDETVLVLGGLDEVQVDEVHVRDLLAAHGNVRPRDAGAPPARVGRHRRLRDRPVQKALGVLWVLGALDERVALEGPRHA